jgi:hypothetical protein
VRAGQRAGRRVHDDRVVCARASHRPPTCVGACVRT